MEPTQTAETAVPEGPPPPYWVGVTTWIAVALVGLVALQIVGIVLQASALGRDVESLSFANRLGYSFLQNLDQAPLAFELLAAVILVILPVITRQPTSRGHDRAAQIVLVGVAGLSLLIAIGGVLGVPARLEIIDLSDGKVTPVIRRVLFTFVVRNVGMAILAMAAALVCVRVRFAPRRVAAATEPIA